LSITPTISIITICLNEINSINHTINSVINQSADNFEWIVIDGGSTDGTAELFTDRKVKQLNFYVQSKSFKGLYGAMNQGLSLAKGNYVLFLNGGDSFFSNDSLELISKSLSHSGADIIYGECVYRGSNKISLIPMQRFPRLSMYLGRNFAHQSVVYRLSLFKDHQFDTTLNICADLKLHLDLLNSGVRFIRTKQLISVIEDGGVSSRQKSLYKKEFDLIFEPRLGMFEKIFFRLILSMQLILRGNGFQKEN